MYTAVITTAIDDKTIKITCQIFLLVTRELFVLLLLLFAIQYNPFITYYFTLRISAIQKVITL